VIFAPPFFKDGFDKELQIFAGAELRRGGNSNTGMSSRQRQFERQRVENLVLLYREAVGSLMYM
jgi:hypothetical protein